jgi:hypothetical protein
VNDFLNLDFKGVDHSLDLSVSMVDGSLGTEVQFHALVVVFNDINPNILSKCNMYKRNYQDNTIEIK